MTHQTRITVQAVTHLSLDYMALARSLRRPLDPAVLGAALLEALADRYEAEHPHCALHQFKQSAATYLFDLASSAALRQEDRTVAGWACTSSGSTTALKSGDGSGCIPPSLLLSPE